jgi:EAL domain-containing protein (putative c-di-GMP-specific phosphodiesterase class I)
LIERVGKNLTERQVVEGIYNFAHNLGIEVIAEYVSDDEIYTIIKDIGIEYVQGYFIGNVMSCEEVIKLRESS